MWVNNEDGRGLLILPLLKRRNGVRGNNQTESNGVMMRVNELRVKCLYKGL